MDFRRKSERIAVKESLQDVPVPQMEVTVVPVEKAKNSKKAVKEIKVKTEGELQSKFRMRKRSNTIEKVGKRKYVRKKPFVSKKAKIQAQIDTINCANSENSHEVSSSEEKVSVDKLRSYRVEQLNPVINYNVSWDEDNLLQQNMGKLNIKKLTNYDSINFGNNGNGDMKISSWSIDGINKLIEKGGIEFFHREKSDIFCLQNLKCSSEEEIKSKLTLDGYEAHFNLGIGMPGSGVLTKITPLSVKFDTEVEVLDEFNSVMVLEFEDFQLVSVNAPTAGFGLKKLKKKLSWHDALNDYIDELSLLDKPLVITGNFQAALHEIDVANPKYSRKQAGFTKEESTKMQELLEMDMIDTFRKFYPNDNEGFTFFTNYPNHGHVMEHGSRIDYFIVSKELQENVLNSVIRSEVVDFTHSPITLFMFF